MKIAIVTWYNDKVKQYADINYSINKKYCELYGYDIIKSNVIQTKFSATWERFPLLIDNMFEYDYVMWIDSDAIFLKNSPPITNIINKYPDKLFIFSSDVDSLCDNDINAGVIIVKSCPYSAKILKEMYTNSTLMSYGYGYIGYPGCQGDSQYIKYVEDQGAIRYMYSQNLFSLKERSVVVPYGVLQLFPQYIHSDSIYRPHNGDENIPYIYHLAGTPHESRVVFSRLYIKVNFPSICKCGCDKYVDVPACCILCHKNKGHGPLCLTHGSKDNPNWLNLHNKRRSK